MRLVRLGLLFAFGVLFVAPAASAYTVTVHVHGAGAVTETTARNLMNCDVSPNLRSEASSTDCVAGTAAGLYAFGDIVNLRASVPTEAFNRGWRFLKWVDSAAGGGQINCDPQDQAGDRFNVDCQFQIFETLQTNLYFDDVEGPQDTSISTGPSSRTASTSATFNFNAASDPDSTFECKLDRPGGFFGSYALCGGLFDKSESYGSLTANGSYTFTVRGRDASGNLDLSPATWTWTVDTVPPDTSLGGGPAEGSFVATTSATFTLGSTESGSFLCQLDSAGAASCTSPRNLSGLSEGLHTFRVWARDGLGNQDLTPATRSWTVDSVMPTVSVATPANGSFRASTGFTPTYTVTDATTTAVTCAVDALAFGPCGAVSGLSQGGHTFSVKAVDRAGNTTTQTNSFTVDTVKPNTKLTAFPPLRTTSRSATFRFKSTEPTGARFQCKLDAGAWKTCTSPKTYRSLRRGLHTVKVRAIDRAGNKDPTPATRTWRIT